jgi:hypothetical protein
VAIVVVVHGRSGLQPAGVRLAPAPGLGRPAESIPDLAVAVFATTDSVGLPAGVELAAADGPRSCVLSASLRLEMSSTALLSEVRPNSEISCI